MGLGYVGISLGNYRESPRFLSESVIRELLLMAQRGRIGCFVLVSEDLTWSNFFLGKLSIPSVFLSSRVHPFQAECNRTAVLALKGVTRERVAAN